MIAHIDRTCPRLCSGNYPHTWERLNWNEEPFKRGRVIFFCGGECYGGLRKLRKRLGIA